MKLSEWIDSHGLVEKKPDPDSCTFDIISLVYTKGDLTVRFIPIQWMPHFYFWRGPIEQGILYPVTEDNLEILESQL